MYALLNIPQPFEEEYSHGRFTPTLNTMSYRDIGEHEMKIVEMLSWSFGGSIEVVKCKECKHRHTDQCPMRFVEDVEWDDDGWLEHDEIEHDYTEDDGFCNKGERK